MRIPLSLVFLAGLFAPLAAEPAATPSPTGDIIRLPAYPVRGDLTLRRPEAWRHAQLGEFEVLSNASEKNTAQFLTRFWRFQELFRELFPLAKNLPQLPLTIVLCGQGGKFDELVSDTQTGVTGRSSYFACDADQGVIIVDLEKPPELPEAGMSAAELIATSSGGDDQSSLESDVSRSGALDADQMLSREYIHFTLSRFSPRPPVWFAEGLAQLYSRLEIDGDSYKFGNLDGGLGHFFTQRQLMPFDQFFTVRYDSPEFLQPMNGMFPAQSLALVHLCLYRNGGKLQKPLFELVRRAGREPVTEKLFKEVFGFGYNEMALRIRGHVDGVVYTSEAPKLPREIAVPALDLRDATDAEVGRIKGDALRLEGRLAPARLELLSPYLRGNSDPRLLAAIGFLDRTEQNTPIAKKYLALATDAHVPLPGPYVYLAEMRLAELTAPGAPPISPAQAVELFRLLGAAGAMTPPRSDVYRLLAETWLHSEVSPKPENLAVLGDAVRAFPRDPGFLYAAARARLRAGQKPEAAMLADLGLKSAGSEAERKQFAELKAQIAR